MNDSRFAGTVLVVDDDAAQRSLLESFLTAQGVHVLTVASGEEALRVLASESVAMMISDVRMPGISGLELLREVRKQLPDLPVMLVTAYAQVRDAVGAMRDGALDYLEKPIDLDALFGAVQRAVGVDEARPADGAGEFPFPPGVVVESPQMESVFREVALVAPSHSRVLVTGESGTGKEVIADVIHAWSPRSSGPIVKVNCAAIPESLLESELFGHERGAFTGATEQRVGLFEQANGGTILLDEVAEMTPNLQAKLLRVTQDGAFQRIGSNEQRRTDTRIVAATNRNLEREVDEKRFREDLFYRLNVIEIYVPPLRERHPDIMAMAQHFVEQFSGGKPRFSSSATTCLESYEWPGNVRELRNAMERAALLARGELILPEHLPRRVCEAVATVVDSDEPQEVAGKRMEDIERAAILQTLAENGYNRTEAARTLGISRRALTYKIRRYREQGYSVEPD